MAESQNTFPWPENDHQWYLDELRNLRDEDLPSGRMFYSSYKKFDSLTVDQVNKTKKFYSQLTPEVKKKVECSDYSFVTFGRFMKEHNWPKQVKRQFLMKENFKRIKMIAAD
jgi:hypothetical protein